MIALSGYFEVQIPTFSIVKICPTLLLYPSPKDDGYISSVETFAIPRRKLRSAPGRKNAAIAFKIG